MGMTAFFSITSQVQAAEPLLKPSPQLGSRIPRKPDDLTGERQARLLEAFARCVVATRPDQVEPYLRKTDDAAAAPDMKQAGRVLPLSFCLGNDLGPKVTDVAASFKMSALRGWLAEMVYKSAYQSLPKDPIAPIAQHTFFSVGNDLITAQSVAGFSDCIVASDPTGSDALIRTPWGSAKELALAKALAPALSSCLEEGSEIKLNATNIRLFAAKGLWWRYVASNFPGGGSTNRTTH